MPRASVIAAFYKRVDFLRLVAAGFDRQSEEDFELLVADDGSPDEVAASLQELQKTSAFPLRHVWHEDRGWRKNTIMNKAVKQASSDYLIFMDADCVPHRHFVREHLRNRESGKILSGRRVNLSEPVTQRLTPELVRSGYLERNILRWLFKGIGKELSHAEKALYLPLFRRILVRKKKGLLGCNFSIHATDLYRINGFDERYLAPAVGEDTDVEFRANMEGIGIKSVRNLAIQYHLHHKQLDHRDPNNFALHEETQRGTTGFTPYGLVQRNAGQRAEG